MIYNTNSIIFTITCLLIWTIPTFRQDKERFPGELELKLCEVKVDLYYSTKKNEDLMKSVEKYKDKELVLVRIDKKKGTTYTYYYLIGAETSLGPTAYLIETKYLEEYHRERFYLFLGYKPKKHKFYDAECFKQNPVSQKLEFKTYDASIIK